MKIRTKLFILLALVIGISLLISYRGNNAEQSAKVTKAMLACPDCNVLIIGFDALQANKVGHLGYKTNDTTPTLDALAKQGVSFTRNFSVASWTVPSFMSYFTSLYPAEHKVTNKFSTFTKERQELANLQKLSPNVRTLAQALRDAGYITGGFTGDAGVGSVFGYSQGFDAYTDEVSFGSIENSGEHALQWLDENAGKKFFIFLHGYDAHGQFSGVDSKYRSRFGLSGNFEITPKRQQELREEGLVKGKLTMTDAEIRDWNSWYDGKIRDADERIANFLSQLEERGLTKNLLIVVISDHGTEIMEHDRFDHGFSLYNELLRVPLIIVWPDRKIGSLITTQVRSIDLAPTLFDVLGIDPGETWKKQMRGESLLPLITREDAENRPVFSETNYRDYTYKRSYIDKDGWKYIYTFESGEEELYDLNSDFAEKHNLVDSQKTRAEQLKEALFAHMRSVGENPEGKWITGCLPVYGNQCIGK